VDFLIWNAWKTADAVDREVEAGQVAETSAITSR